MKSIYLRVLFLLVGSFSYSASQAAVCLDPADTTCNWLNVPGDFANPTNNFTMYLLGGEFHIDTPYRTISGTGWRGAGNAQVDTASRQIDFTASQFDHIGAGQGTSTLNANFNHYVIGSGDFWGSLATLYIDGTATGSLIDTAGSTEGNWTLNTHLYADWNGSYGIDVGYIPISTSASYTYAQPGGFCPANGIGNACVTSTGSIMNYHTGLAYLVGQGVVQSGAFQGVRITLGLNGQDPLVSTVPVPASLWLLGSGGIGLIGIARKRKAA